MWIYEKKWYGRDAQVSSHCVEANGDSNKEWWNKKIKTSWNIWVWNWTLNPEAEPAAEATFHLHRKTGYFSISQRLWYSGQPDSEACKQVHLKPLQVVPRQPGEDGQPGRQCSVGAAAPGNCCPTQQRLIHCSKVRGEWRKPGEEDDSRKDQTEAACAQRLEMWHFANMRNLIKEERRKERGKATYTKRTLNVAHCGVGCLVCFLLSPTGPAVRQTEKKLSYMHVAVCPTVSPGKYSAHHREDGISPDACCDLCVMQGNTKGHLLF